MNNQYKRAFFNLNPLLYIKILWLCYTEDFFFVRAPVLYIYLKWSGSFF